MTVAIAILAAVAALFIAKALYQRRIERQRRRELLAPLHEAVRDTQIAIGTVSLPVLIDIGRACADAAEAIARRDSYAAE